MMVDALEENVMKDILSMGLEQKRKITIRWPGEQPQMNSWLPILEYILEQSSKHWLSAGLQNHDSMFFIWKT